MKPIIIAGNVSPEFKAKMAQDMARAMGPAKKPAPFIAAGNATTANGPAAVANISMQGMTKMNVHTITIFDIAEIRVEYDDENKMYDIRLIGADREQTRIHAWGDTDKGKPPRLRLTEDIVLSAGVEPRNAKVHNDLMKHLYGVDSWRNEL